MAKSSAKRVRVADDFRDNLIIDRFDPLFLGMRASKLDHMRSENSEDAVTWNVFRSLRQITPDAWLPVLWGEAHSGGAPRYDGLATYVWRSIAPPPSLVFTGDEGPSEIDVLIETPWWVWVIEAKYTSDISERTTSRSDRDQVIRNIDVGSYFSGTRDFYFSLLVKDEHQSPRGARAVGKYSDLEGVRALLAGHRPDGLPNLKSVTLITWAQLGHTLYVAARNAPLAAERGYAERALAWLKVKGLAAAA